MSFDRGLSFEGRGDGDVMTDEDFEKAIDEMQMDGETDLGDLLKAMNENQMISWEEAERILADSSDEPVKCTLPEQTRPSEPENDTNVDQCIQRLLDNDPTLKEISLNNLKRTPIPAIKRLIEASAYNEYLEKLSLANMGLYDKDIEMLVQVLELNSTIRVLNLETNYLSGDFFSKLFQASLTHQSVEEIKCVNQGVSFATTAEKEIIKAIQANRGLIKVSINLRLPEGRHKIENATLRNGEIRRQLRREAALQARLQADADAKEAEEKKKKDILSAMKARKQAPAAPAPAPAPKMFSKPAPAPRVPKPKPAEKPIELPVAAAKPVKKEEKPEEKKVAPKNMVRRGPKEEKKEEKVEQVKEKKPAPKNIIRRGPKVEEKKEEPEKEKEKEDTEQAEEESKEASPDEDVEVTDVLRIENGMVKRVAVKKVKADGTVEVNDVKEGDGLPKKKKIVRRVVRKKKKEGAEADGEKKKHKEKTDEENPQSVSQTPTHSTDSK